MRCWDRAFIGCLIGVFCLLVVACGSPSKRVYQPNLPVSPIETFPIKVAVVEFEDSTLKEGFAYYPGSRDPKGFLPGVLSVTDAVVFRHTLFGKCLAAELQDAKIFITTTYHSSWESLGREFKSYDIIMTGRLVEDRVEVHGQFYGLSLLSPILYLIGLPAFTYSRDVLLEVTALKSLQPDQHLFNHTVKFRDASWKGLFTASKDDDLVSVDKQLGGHQVTHTDHCTTKPLQPQFLALRERLKTSVKDNVVPHGEITTKQYGEGRGL